MTTPDPDNNTIGAAAVVGLDVFNRSVGSGSERLNEALLAAARDAYIPLRADRDRLASEVRRLNGALNTMTYTCRQAEQDREKAARARDALAGEVKRLELQSLELIRERDRAEEYADDLAAGVARHLGVDIGEHSNRNVPWLRALEALDDATCTPAGEAKRLREFIEDLLNADREDEEFWDGLADRAIAVLESTPAAENGVTQ